MTLNQCQHHAVFNINIFKVTIFILKTRQLETQKEQGSK